MKNDMLKELQEYHYDLKDVDGNWRKEPIGSLYTNGTSDKNIETIKKILNIVLDSDFISIETKVFISSKGISIREVNQFINDARAMKLTRSGKVLRPINYNTTCSKLSQDNNDLLSYLGGNILRGIAKNNIVNEKETNHKLVKFKERYGVNENYRDNLDVNIRVSKPEVNEYMNNEEFFEILGSLEPYLVQRKEIIAQAVNANDSFVNYFNYLLSKQAIDNDLVRVDRERLIKFLKNEDYITDYESSDAYQKPEESFFDSDEQLRQLKPDDIDMSEKGMSLNNYTALNYDKASSMIEA